jgi:glycosyltransferase involved in cell wall biosynthesis
MSAERPRILMAVFNPLDFDGRVQRSAEALGAIADVEVFAIEGRTGFKPPDSYRLSVLPVQAGEFGSNRMLHLRFLRELVKRARQMRPHLVYAHDFFLATPGWIAARLSGARFVYDAHELVIPGALGRDYAQLQERIWYWLEKFAVRRAELVIAANEPRARVMQEHYRLAQQPTSIRNITVPPPAANDRAELLLKYPVLARRDSDECLCVYQGDVDLHRGLAPVMDAFALLGPGYRLLVVGGGPDVENVRARAAQYGDRARVDVVGKVPRATLHGILSACDIGICVYAYTGLNNIYCSPNKVFEYAQAGLAVVATGQPPLVELVADSGIGRIAGTRAPPTAEEMAEAIRQARATLGQHRAALPGFLAGNRWQDEMQRLRSAVQQLSPELAGM